MSSQRPPTLARPIVWDNHGCMPLRADASFLPQLSRYSDAGFDVVSLNVGMADVPLLEHLRVLSFMRRWISDHADQYQLIASVQDIAEAKKNAKLGVVFDIEGMCPVQDDLSFVRTFYELGVRWMLVAYNLNNKAGGGCLDNDGGLTAVGRAIIDEMERVGMVLCLSHAGARTVSDALDYARNPPIFSHSNPYGDHPHSRNVRDDLLRRCAAKGGVVGLSGLGPFLGANEHLVERLLRQVRYLIDLVGPEHVGLGLDYVFDQQELNDFLRDNPHLFPPGFDAERALPMIAPEDLEGIMEGLARDNFSEAQIQGILGGNWLRVASQVWR